MLNKRHCKLKTINELEPRRPCWCRCKISAQDAASVEQEILEPVLSLQQSRSKIRSRSFSTYWLAPWRQHISRSGYSLSLRMFRNRNSTWTWVRICSTSLPEQRLIVEPRVRTFKREHGFSRIFCRVPIFFNFSWGSSVWSQLTGAGLGTRL